MIGESIKDQLKKLVELQKIDGEIFNFKKDITEKPAALEQLKQEFEFKKAKLNSLEERLKKIQLDRKEHEGELKQKEDLIAKADGQLSQLKTNKEYQAKLLEIENIKADKSIVEEKILISFDEAEAVQKEIAQEKSVVAVEETGYLEKKKVVDEEIKQSQDKLRLLEAQRGQYLGGIQPDFLARYERILNNKEGLAIVPVRNRSCQGCYMSINEQVVNALKMHDRLIQCEMCARLLYLEEEL